MPDPSTLSDANAPGTKQSEESNDGQKSAPANESSPVTSGSATEPAPSMPATSSVDALPMAAVHGAHARAAGTSGETVRGHGRWWLGVAVGLAVSLPLSWLLSYAGALMFYLGIFFFALFGLIIGAATFRVASVTRPYRRKHVIIGTTMLVLVPWSLSMLKEGRDFPNDVAARTVQERSLDLKGNPVAAHREIVTSDVRAYLRKQYPPGGILGYMHWVVVDGKISKTDVSSLAKNWHHGQSGFVWVVRVILSLALLTFGVATQTLPMRAKHRSDAI